VRVRGLALLLAGAHIARGQCGVLHRVAAFIRNNCCVLEAKFSNKS